jgi:hypothetical protein
LGFKETGWAGFGSGKETGWAGFSSGKETSRALVQRRLARLLITSSCPISRRCRITMPWPGRYRSVREDCLFFDQYQGCTLYIAGTSPCGRSCWRTGACASRTGSWPGCTARLWLDLFSVHGCTCRRVTLYCQLYSHAMVRRRVYTAVRAVECTRCRVYAL